MVQTETWKDPMYGTTVLKLKLLIGFGIATWFKIIFQYSKFVYLLTSTFDAAKWYSRPLRRTWLWITKIGKFLSDVGLGVNILPQNRRFMFFLNCYPSCMIIFDIVLAYYPALVTTPLNNNPCIHIFLCLWIGWEREKWKCCVVYSGLF